MSTSPDVEDPFIYQDADGNFHALLHNLAGPHMCGGFECSVGTHAFSLDGFKWWYGSVAYTNRVQFADGSELLLNRRERPHLVFAENSRIPVALSCSAEIGGHHGDRSFTLVQALESKELII